ncbi:hypothetical protein MalM25_05750 [Planctomycetes bacterium MalM25]|nr:hypothetical protein MalM25_05750 [Planctomycetes bacterium MalM25]
MISLKPRFKTRTLLAIVTTICVLLGTLHWLVERFSYRLTGTGEIYASEGWPYSLKVLTKQLGQENAKRPRVYSIGARDFFLDEEYLWRLDIKPDQLELVIDELDLESIDWELPTPEMFERRQPTWWRSDTDEDAQMFISSFFSLHDRGNDGEHFFAVYNKESGALRVWHKSNF